MTRNENRRGERVRWRTVALPAEHGSWGLALEPIVLGLAIDFSTAGMWLAIGVFALFLMRRPFRVVLAERETGRRARALTGAAFLMAYGGAACFGFGRALAVEGWRPLLPMVFALPFLGLFLVYDLSGRSRAWQPQVAGAVFFASVASAIAFAGDVPHGIALSLAAVLIARSVPAILYVRCRIRLDKNREANILPALVSHTVAFAAIACLVGAGTLSLPVLIPFAALFGRAAVGLSPARSHRAPVRHIGFVEMGYGILTLACVAGGHHAGLYMA